ncbi:porin [Sulfuriflexus mobilis]|uniref:porin n=1 Tax=Sulfuriflexus mobilis TaxID=1811807 RepID=UPI000F83696F|nr:porin [Sulfuriflexus mobilis]
MKYPVLLRQSIVLTALTTTGLVHAAAGPAPTIEELWTVIQAQQKQLEALKAKAQQTEEKVEATGEILEQQVASSGGHGGSGKTTIGGYGELHYNNLEAGDGTDTKEIDLHRFVVYFGHEFNERTRFVSELEVEHGGVEADGSPLDGEVEVEQAYVEFDINDEVSAKGGVFLLPVGIINETHEPPTFYGVERNPVESVIVPATWWAGGAAVTGNFANGLSADLALHSGLQIPTTGSSAFRIRSGRQKISNANANDLAMTGRLKYTGIPGLELSGSVHYQNDISQVSGDGADEATLLEAHAIWNRGPFTAKALYASWDIDGDAVEAADADKQDGYYVEGSYKLTKEFGVFARFNDVDGVRVQDEFDQVDVGFNWWPHEDVVIKVDYMDRENDNDSDRDVDGFNVGIGYQF